MYLLLKLLNAIKVPHLNKDDWSLIADIYADLEKKDFYSFEIAFLKQRKPSAAVAEFMRYWFSIVNELQELKSIISKYLTIDDKLLIAVNASLLPNNTVTLNEIAQKTESLCLVAIKSDYTYDLLTNFSLSLSYKMQPNNKLFIEHDMQDAIHSIYNELLVKKLRCLCRDYLDSIVSNIGDYLKHDTYCLLYYQAIMRPHKIHIPSLIRSEIEAMSFDSEVANMTPLLQLLFRKFVRLDDLIHILNGTIKYVEGENINVVNDAPIKQRLSIFATCFGDYAKTFEKRIYDTNYSFFASSYTNEPLEDDFIKICSDISDRILSSSIKPTK